jgi:uncharacterized membrane protein YfcA
MSPPVSATGVARPARPAGHATAAATVTAAPAGAAQHPAALVLLCALAVGGYAAALPAAWSGPAPPAAALFAVFAAAGLSSVAGFAFSALCAAFLLPLGGVDHVAAVRIMMVCSVGIQALSVWSLRRAVAPRLLIPFLLGGLLTLPLGVHWLLHLSQRGFTTAMGALLLAYGAWMLLRRPFVLPLRWRGPVGDAFAGAVGGVTGGLAAFPGAFVTVWCGLRGWSKERQRGVFQPFILLMQLAALAWMELLAGPQRGPGALALGLADAVAYLPPALLGTLCGLSLYRRLTDRQFGTAVNLLLIASGAALLA